MERLLPIALLTAGCAITPSDVGVTADCGPEGDVENPTLVLMAQSVPTAELIPCVQLEPAAWSLSDLDARSGRSTFTFRSSLEEDAGHPLLTVTLTAGCDVSGATEVQSDEPLTRRYERLREISPGYVGDRYYVYPGGCTTYRFDLTSASRRQQIGAAALAVGFVSREAVREGVRRRSEGRLELDP